MLCFYGCGKIGKYKLKNGKLCCSKNYQACPELRLKNSLSRMGSNDNNSHHNENKIKTLCEFCSKEFAITGIKSHKENCYLNPKNKRECPICGNPIKKFRINKTCSARCGTILAKNIIYIEEETDGCRNNYRLICFKYHRKKCLICDEELLLEVHHIDGNRANSNPENTIPLCPTHHGYCHHKIYWYIIKERIEEYIKDFKNKHKIR